MLITLQDSKDKNKAKVQFLLKQMVNLYSLELNFLVAVYVRYFRIQPTIHLLMFGVFFHSIQQLVPQSKDALIAGHEDGRKAALWAWLECHTSFLDKGSYHATDPIFLKY